MTPSSSPANSKNHQHCIQYGQKTHPDFCFPKIVIVDRDCREAAILVTVPKATVNEYGNLVLGKNDVGFAGQVLSVQPKAVAMCKQKASHQNFGFGVFAFDVRHTFLTLFFR